MVTVAILAQGTEWADAFTQAFLQGFNSPWVLSVQSGGGQKERAPAILEGFCGGSAKGSGRILWGFHWGPAGILQEAHRDSVGILRGFCEDSAQCGKDSAGILRGFCKPFLSIRSTFCRDHVRDSEGVLWKSARHPVGSP